MSKSAPPKRATLSRKALNLVALLGPMDGSAPTKVDQVDWLHPLRIERSAGGGRVDVCTFAYDLALQQERIVDTLAPKAVFRELEIRELDKNGDVARVLMWGKLGAQPVQIDAGNETLSYQVRLDNQLFGTFLHKLPMWDVTSSSVKHFDRPLLFNPVIDEKVQPNCSNKKDAARDNIYLIYEPGGPNTAAARTTHAQTFTAWKLYQAVHFICWLLNPNQTYVKNPSLAECFTALLHVDATSDRFKNVGLRKGLFLPQALDQLLNPFGASWYVDYSYDATEDKSVRRLKFFVRNEGTQRELFLQRPEQQLVTTKSNTPSLGINYDVVNLANKIVGVSSLKQVEITVELWKGWPISEDSLDREALMKDSTVQLAHPHAGRKWVWNESGAWTALRPEITAPASLTSLFGGDDVLVKARKFLPCLSRWADPQSNELESRGIFVEWLNPDTSAWEPVPWSYSVLEQECGIWFETVPQALWDAVQTDPTTARIRVTATIEGDSRLVATAAHADTSPNLDDVPLLIDLSDRFHSRSVQTSGGMASRFAGEIASADIQDDAVEMATEVAKIRNIEDAAELACSATLEGLDHPEYSIGDLITGVNGRNLKLNRNNPDPTVTPKYLQIMGITLDVQSQKMELCLESFDEEQL